MLFSSKLGRIWRGSDSSALLFGLWTRFWAYGQDFLLILTGFLNSRLCPRAGPMCTVLLYSRNIFFWMLQKYSIEFLKVKTFFLAKMSFSRKWDVCRKNSSNFSAAISETFSCLIAQINKKPQKMSAITKCYLTISRSGPPGGHFGFCRWWASAPFAARLVLDFT